MKLFFVSWLYPQKHGTQKLVGFVDVSPFPKRVFSVFAGVVH